MKGRKEREGVAESVLKRQRTEIGVELIVWNKIVVSLTLFCVATLSSH